MLLWKSLFCLVLPITVYYCACGGMCNNTPENSKECLKDAYLNDNGKVLQMLWQNPTFFASPPQKFLGTTEENELHNAAFYANYELVSNLLVSGFPVNSLSWEGLTPLAEVARSVIGRDDGEREGAYYNANFKVAKLLLSYGADLCCGKPLHWAAVCGNMDVVQLLLYHGKEKNISGYVNCIDSEGRTALHCAIGNGHLEMACSLIEHGANPFKKDFQGVTPTRMFTKVYWEEKKKPCYSRDQSLPILGQLINVFIENGFGRKNLCPDNIHEKQ